MAYFLTHQLEGGWGVGGLVTWGSDAAWKGGAKWMTSREARGVGVGGTLRAQLGRRQWNWGLRAGCSL